MKSFILQRKIPVIFLLMLIILACNLLDSQAQHLKRQCVSSYGSAVLIDNTAFLQTVGQPFYTATSAEKAPSVLQGFQQPIVIITDQVKTDGDIILKVFPNPASHSVTIHCDDGLKNPFITVKNINGKKILEDELSELNDFEINCENWETGMYLISICAQNQPVQTIKLTIIK